LIDFFTNASYEAIRVRQFGSSSISCVWHILYEYDKSSVENMDARYFPYLNQPNAKEDINKQDIQESCTIYGNTQTPQQPTTSKCGNFIRSDLLPKTSDVVEDNFQFAPNKSMC